MKLTLSHYAIATVYDVQTYYYTGTPFPVTDPRDSKLFNSLSSAQTLVDALNQQNSYVWFTVKINVRKQA